MVFMVVQAVAKESWLGGDSSGAVGCFETTRMVEVDTPMEEHGVVRGGAGCWHCWFSGLWKRVWGTWCMKDMDGHKVEVLFGKDIVLGSNGSVGRVRCVQLQCDGGMVRTHDGLVGAAVVEMHGGMSGCTKWSFGG